MGHQNHGNRARAGVVDPVNGAGRPERPIRLGFVLRSFTYGGAEHDIIQLITASDPQVLQCTGLAIQMPYPICPDLPLEHPRVPVLYQPEAVTRHAKVVPIDSFAAAVGAVAATADVLVTWGVPDLADVLPLWYSGRIVVTSKASGAYQESFLHANALLTSDYVGNSLKSNEAYPAAVRHRAEVIYPGLDERRLVGSGDRPSQRSEWGVSADEHLVGYLGRIAPDKGVEQIVEAVRTMGPRWKAVFVGCNGNFPDYEQHFARLCRDRLPGRHRIVEWTTNIADTLGGFDVLAYPTQEEGFSNTLAEAWALGVPTVATAGVGALAEPRWARCAVTIEPDFTTKELARAIETACGNRPLIDTARRAAQSLTVAATLKRWQSYFGRLVRQPRRTRVMVLLPNALIGGIPSWLLTLMNHTPQLDWCCLCLLSEMPDHAADEQVLNAVLEHGCPVMGIPPLPAEERRQRLLQAIRQTRPDVILQSGVKRLDECLPRLDIPLVTVSHGPADCDWAREVLAHSSRCASHRVAISTTARDAFAPEFRPGVSIIHNGVDTSAGDENLGELRRRSRRRLQLGPEEIAVGFVGRLSPEKNPLAVARAVATLPQEYRGVFIGPDCADTLAQIHQVAPRCLALGPVSPSEVPSLMPALDVLVCPSEYESFGLAIVEAWIAEVPVVSTRVGIVAERADEDLAVVVPMNPQPAALARGIVQAIQESEKRIARCRTIARESYNAIRMGHQWQEFLQRVSHPAHEQNVDPTEAKASVNGRSRPLERDVKSVHRRRSQLTSESSEP